MSTNTVHELKYGQSWLGDDEKPLRNPGTVRLERRGDTLFVEARLRDENICDPEAKFNDEAYKHGDVFELFIKGEGDDHYHEIHVTPSNVLLQLRFEVGEKRPFNLEKARVWEPLLKSSTEKVDGGWIARYEVPLANLSDQKPLPTRWQVGCGRYDYQPGLEKPVMTNTAPLTVCDFHRHAEWPVYELA